MFLGRVAKIILGVAWQRYCKGWDGKINLGGGME